MSRALWVLPGLIATFAIPAFAEEPTLEIRRGADLLAHEERRASDPSWLSTHLDRVSVHKKSGLAYTRAIDHGDRGLVWSVRGPAVGGKKTVGLGFELRF
ncbi:MAG: hypothetical protein ACR2P8_10565 [Myxococcota bacterium]